jgi:hypothetical protein
VYAWQSSQIRLEITTAVDKDPTTVAEYQEGIDYDTPRASMLWQPMILVAPVATMIYDGRHTLRGYKRHLLGKGLIVNEQYPILGGTELSRVSSSALLYAKGAFLAT